MKKLLLIFVLISSSVFGQDNEMLDFINLYRKHNGKKELKLSESLTSISFEQNKKIISEDSLSHSHKSSEIAVMGKNLPSTMETKTDFFMFVESLGITYKEPKNDEEAVKYTKLYCLFFVHTFLTFTNLIVTIFNLIINKKMNFLIKFKISF